MPDTDTLDAPVVPAQEKLSERASFRLAAFGAVLVVVLFAGYGLGRLNESGTAATRASEQQQAAGPAPVGESQPHGHGATSGGSAEAPAAAASGEAVGGLALTGQGLTLAIGNPAFTAGQAGELTFRVTGGGGTAVTTFQVKHDKPLHLVVVRRDLSGFQHLHPEMAADGTWRVPLTLVEPGSYRAIADFTAVVGGQEVATTLGADLTVAGDYRPVELPAASREAVGGDFRVSYEGEPRVGAAQPLFVSVGSAELEPYLGAYGHLVVLREGDVGYVHVHPEPELVDGKVKFWLAAPGPGKYRMFFDFQVAGLVHTAAWTAVVS